mmetsp:Transcript_2897/g.5429  ORF Transcript_2897/g.5429 Transcript_2897/m.5429 type:complete len:324 (+) Transcript_2897:238-1209(+)
MKYLPHLLLPALSIIHSSIASYNVYNYDLNTPVFTPDGLLKQVEYASESSSHSEPLLVIPFTIHHPTATNTPEHLLIMATRYQSQRAQSRILLMPIAFNPLASVERSLLVGINGILPDCVSLLQTAKEEIQLIQSTYGAPNMLASKLSSNGRLVGSQPPLPSIQCAKRVAHAMGDKCQQNSFGGGIRPFGAEIVVCGMDLDGTVGVYVNQPSGAVLEYTHSSLEYGKVVGGDSKKREKLQGFVKEKMESLDNKIDGDALNDSATLIRERIRLVVQAILNLYPDEKKKDQVENVLNEIDIVIAHSSQGIFRLSGDRLKKILDDT